MLHRFLERQLPRGQLPACGKGSFSTANGRLVRILVDRLGLQVGQLPQLGLAETRVTQAFHDAVEFRGGSHGPVRGSQHTGSRRCLPAGDDFALIAYLETAVGVFQDFHLHSGIAGTLGAGEQLPPLRPHCQPLPEARWESQVRQAGSGNSAGTANRPL